MKAEEVIYLSKNHWSVFVRATTPKNNIDDLEKTDVTETLNEVKSLCVCF